MPDDARKIPTQNDWQTLVRERLGTLGVSPECEEEVVRELAGHMDDRIAAAARSGMSESEAVAMVLEEVPDWVALNKEITAAKEGIVKDRMKQIWVPGMTMLMSAFILMSAAVRLMLPAAWTQPGTPPIFYASFLITYVVLGALGAQWSRRAGGNTRTRFLAGIFPVALHLVIFICVLIAANLQNPPRTPEYLQPGFQLRVFLSFVIVPGIALAVGAVPFLRKRTQQTVPSRA